METARETLVVLALLLLPGYLAAEAFVRNNPYAEPSELRFVLQLTVWSALVHLIALPVTIPLIEVIRRDPGFEILTTSFWFAVSIWFVLFLIVVPLGLGVGLGGLMATRPLQRLLSRYGMGLRDQLPTAWDWTLRPRRAGGWLRVYLKNYDEPVSGRFGRESFVGLSPHSDDIFLERLTKRGSWDLVPDSAGVWIAADQVDFVEFYDEAPSSGGSNARST